MSSSRRSSKSTKSTATTRSFRPPVWRPTAPITKNSSAAEVSTVNAEREGVSPTSASAASKLAPTISKRSKLASSGSVDGRPIVERRNSTRTRLQDVFLNEGLDERGSSVAASRSDSKSSSTSVESTPVYAPSLSSSPGKTSSLASFGRYKGKEKVSMDRNASPSVQDTPEPGLKSLGVDHIDMIENNTELSSAIEALDSTQSHATETIRAAYSEVQVPDSELSKTIRRSERRRDPGPQKHTWFNPFAPYPPHSQNTGSAAATSTSASPTTSSPLSRASSSHIGSVDDEVPGLLSTPAHSDDEEGHKLQRKRSHLTSSFSPDVDKHTVDDDSSAQLVSTSPADGQTPRSRKRLDSLNSLNPSTSRFSISIPLLGRQKMRLEDAVKRGSEAEDKDEKDFGADSVPNLISETKPTTEAAPTTAVSSIPTSVTTATVQPDSSSATAMPPAITSETISNGATATTLLLPQPSDNPGNATQVESVPRDAANVVTQSWWNYIGWDSSQPSVTRTEVQSTLNEAVEATTENTEDIVTNPTLKPPPGPIAERPNSAPPAMEPSYESAPASAEAKLSTDISPSSPQLQTEKHINTKPPSIFSLDAARAAGSWFFPWTWSGSSPASQLATAAAANNAPNGGESEDVADGGSGDGNDDDGDDKKRNKMTEAEQIKEAALARDKQPPSESPDTHSDSPPLGPTSTSDTLRSSSEEPVNPITDPSLHSGWASFFSLRRGRELVTKNVGLEIAQADDSIKRDENGVEVMDLTDDETTSVNVNVQESELVPDPQSEPEKASTKVPTGTALSLIRALAAPDYKKPRMIEAKDKKSQDVADKDESFPPLPPSPQPSTQSKATSDVPALGSLTGSPSKSAAFRHGRASSVSTTRTSISTGGNKPAPPLTISDDVKASVAAARKAKRPGGVPSGTAGPSSLPKDRAVTPPPERDGLKKEKEKSKSTKSGVSTPATLPPPNLVLPAWEDTFHTLPRNFVPDQYISSSHTTSGFGSTIGRTMKYVSGILLGSDNSGYTSGGEGTRFSAGAGATKRRSRRASSRRRSISGESAIPGGIGVVGEAELIAREREKLRELINWGQDLPKAWDVIDAAIQNRSRARPEKKGKAKAVPGEDDKASDVTKGCKKVVIIGIHGWFPGAVMRSMLGEPTGTSPKFVRMMDQALQEFQSKHGVKFDKITKIPLEGEGTIDRRVEKLYANLLSNDTWVEDLHNADVIFVATHSQGSVVSTHLLDHLIRDRHIRTSKNAASEPVSGLGVNIIPLPPQRVCCLCLCGIHLGPLRYLSSSSVLQPYIQYFESTAARELFEFQNTESDVSKAYVQALRNVVHNETKMVYVASLNDQVVPIYSGLFTSASHPLILRALYIDGDAYSSSDFLTNLLVLLLRILNCGLSDSGLLAHLSEVTAGSLNGIGHSTAYEELSTYSLAVNYLFLANSGSEDHPDLSVEPFNASDEMNDYEIPWALRDLIADEKVAHYFSREITELRDAFRDWRPKTTALRDIKRKLQPIQRLPVTLPPGTANSTSKL